MNREGKHGHARRTVDALPPASGGAVFRDRGLPGFGAHASGRQVCVVRTRGPDGGPGRVSIGRHGETSAVI